VIRLIQRHPAPRPARRAWVVPPAGRGRAPRWSGSEPVRIRARL